MKMEKAKLTATLKAVDTARVQGDDLGITLEETVELISSTISEIEIDLAKFIDKENKQAGKRVRKYTKSLETLGRQFRKLSV